MTTANESPQSVAERLLQQLVEVHQRWCRYCRANNTICRKSEGTSYECTVLATERAVAAEIAKLQAEVEKRNTGWLEQAAKDALIIVGLECELAKREQEIERLNAQLGTPYDLTVCQLELENSRQYNGAIMAERDRLRAALAEAERERDEMGSAINDTLRLADFLNEAAERGAGFAEHWGERVLQAVEALRDVKAFASKTLEHNRILLEANSDFLKQLDEAKAALDAASQKQRERLEQFAASYPCFCAQNYPGATEYHGHDCQNEVAQEFVAQFFAKPEDAGAK